MQITHINAHNIPDAWFQSLWHIMQDGREYVVEKGSFEGHKRREFDFVNIHIHGIQPNVSSSQRKSSDFQRRC